MILRKRPEGALVPDCFELVERELPPLQEGQLAIDVRFLSVDPYMRRRLDEGPSYAPRVELGAVMIGGAVGEVVDSRNAEFAVGDWVLGPLGWQSRAVSDGTGLRKIERTVPPSAYLGVLGMPGVTAHHGLYTIAEPKAGETVVVSAAAGAVGSVVGQLAKLRGCRVVGIAGGPRKCAHVVDDLGFDACVDHRDPQMIERLREATPDGVDVSFENVGGAVMDAVLARLNRFARVSLCGLIAEYDGKSVGLHEYPVLLTQRVRLQGFIISDHLDAWPKALAELTPLVHDGRLQWHETVTVGLEQAPEALIGVLRGDNLGKQIVRI